MVLLDGTLVRTRTRRRTGTDNRKNCSGKHKAHSLLFLALTDDKANLIWISAAKPGRSSETTTARHNKITGHLRKAGLAALADLGFVGLDDHSDDDPVIITGRKATRGHRLTKAEKDANRLLSRERAAVEHGFAKIRVDSLHRPARRGRCRRVRRLGRGFHVGSVADSYDNAMAEALNGTFKAELIEMQGPYTGFDQVERAIFQWAAWYNEERLHSALDYVPPAECERNWWRQQEPFPQSA
ncbi:transposase family protein [Streptomyces chromofuscus]|uniref:Transposase n=1 Tax=Streptomyces chromofuscus TaxID=42881 RepID=A0A7M2T8G2_STRCW|nr:transposase family protein [Streptomyces chromofuscus]QOV44534.1 transposase [Streptomyces chromofuscus]GGT42606.1 hypothetical protein GCM10010254_72710 [Streptomyces chromofuscus]